MAHAEHCDAPCSLACCSLLARLLQIGNKSDKVVPPADGWDRHAAASIQSLAREGGHGGLDAIYAYLRARSEGPIVNGLPALVPRVGDGLICVRLMRLNCQALGTENHPMTDISDDAKRNRLGRTKANAEYTDKSARDSWAAEEWNLRPVTSAASEHLLPGRL
jgi:hypothetical protein